VNRYLGLILGILALAACGDLTIPTPDLVGTQVAVEKAAAATLTAEVPTPSPTLTIAPTRTATPRPETSGTPTPVAGHCLFRLAPAWAKPGRAPPTAWRWFAFRPASF